MPFIPSIASSVLKSYITSATKVGLLNADNKPLAVTGYQTRALGAIKADFPSAGWISNENLIFLFEATEGSDTATQFALYNVGANNQENLIFTGDLKQPVEVSEGHVPLIRAGELQIGLDSITD